VSRKWYLAGAFIILLFGRALAGDEAGDKDCTQASFDSLRDMSECQPRIVQNTIQATIVTLRKGRQDFPNHYRASADDIDTRCQTADRQGRLHNARVCRCEIDVQYVHLGGRQTGIERINKIERDAAKTYRCSAGMAIVGRRIGSVNTSPNLVSILAQGTDYCQGCGGGCHSDNQLITYDAQTGNEYFVSDAVETVDFPRLSDLFIENFMTRYGSRPEDQDDREKIKAGAHDLLAMMDFRKTGIYVERGTVWVNLDGYLLSCSEGDLFPVQIPPSILKPEFLAKLQPRR
jgi:hypothetical protein